VHKLRQAKSTRVPHVSILRRGIVVCRHDQGPCAVSGGGRPALCDLLRDIGHPRFRTLVHPPTCR
jgi:hypothetical protein